MGRMARNMLLTCSLLLIFSTSWGFPQSHLHENEVDSEPSLAEKKEYIEKKFVPKLISYFFNSMNVQEVVNDIKRGKTSSATCNTCRFGVSLLNTYVKSGKGHQEIADSALSLCKSMKMFSDHVCEGTINLFKDEILYVFERSILTTDEVCGAILGRTCGEVVNPFHNWTVTPSAVPKPPVKPIPPPKAGSPVLKVLQLTDTHFDPYYLVGSNAACGDPMCCRLGDGPAPSPENAAGKWGDYRDCDTPLRTLENVLEHISKNHEIDYIYWTGDIPPHDIWNSTVFENLYLLRVTTHLIKQYFPNIQVFPSIGNHESVPVNSFSPPYPEVPMEFDKTWIYENSAIVWKDWLNEENIRTLRKGGFFSKRVRPGLRVISINSNYCNSQNSWLLLNSTDPVQQLQWLVEELQAAEDNQEKVHLIGHIPPGENDCLKVWSRNFYSIVSRYESTVMAQFYGHTHRDEFEVFYDEETLRRPINVAYVAPSVTTFGGVNPAYRIYTVDGYYNGTTYAILDHENYFMNLTEANLSDQPKWKLAYSAKEEYNMTSLNPSEWDTLVHRFETNDELFQKFNRLRFMLSDYKKDTCTQTCKDELICQLRTGRSNDYTFCTLFSQNKTTTGV